MKDTTFKCSTCLIGLMILVSLFIIGINSAKAIIPRPDHVVICIMENHDYYQIIGSTSAPFINTLATQSANMTEYYGLTHPSQPNYIMLFSGSNQGVTSDGTPSGTPWYTPNLGSLLINAGFSFRGYSEDLPYVGSNTSSSGNYARKHNPWVNWQGTGTNQISAGYNLTMNEFPTDFNQLPTLSFVIPNQANDMHDGADPYRITNGDQWVQNHLQNYINWAQTNNSLFILTFDEDNFTPTNHIPLIICGPMVQPGSYYLTGYNHYDLLRTLEDMYGLPYAGQSVSAKPIDEIWKLSGINEVKNSVKATATFYPNPISENSNLFISSNNQSVQGEYQLNLYDITGRLTKEEKIPVLSAQKGYAFRRNGLSDGLYTYSLMNDGELVGSGKIVIE